MRLVTGFVVALAAGAAGIVWAQAQKAGVVPPGDWQTINRDVAATRYSPLTQINTTNVANLKLTWSFPMQGGGTSVPLAVNGIMYISNGGRVTAIDGESGMEVWSFSTSGTTTTPLPTDAQAQAPPLQQRRLRLALRRALRRVRPVADAAVVPAEVQGEAVRPADVAVAVAARRSQRAVSGTGPATASWRRAFSS
jgi:hypothetical protein